MSIPNPFQLIFAIGNLVVLYFMTLGAVVLFFFLTIFMPKKMLYILRCGFEEYNRKHGNADKKAK